MSKVTSDMAMSVDGFVAGPNQSLDEPFGEGVEGRLHQWMFDEPDANAPEIEAMTAAGAFIMGRNMFGPGRGDWDEEWKGWWGEDPPYHAPGIGADSPRARAADDEGGYDVHVRHGRDRVGAGAGACGGGGRQRRDRRRRRDPEPVSSGGTPRRVATARGAGTARRRGAAIRRCRERLARTARS